MKYILSAIIMSIIIFAPSFAWVEGFTYRRCFDLIELTNNSLLNYTYKLTFDTSSLGPKIKSDCSDIIVTDINDTKLDRFLVNCGLSNTYTYFKINIDALGTKTYCLYYGNPSWNEKDVNLFVNYDDFEYKPYLNWTMSGCIISDEDKYKGFYSVKCSSGGYIEAYLNGNELNFAVKGIVTVLGVTYNYRDWNFVTTNMSSGTIRFTAGKTPTYIDTVFTRYSVIEPKAYFHSEESKGVAVIQVESYCQDNYVVNELMTCISTNCTVNKTLSYCYYGCYAGRCNESPFNRAVVLIIVAIGLLFLFYIVWRLTR